MEAVGDNATIRRGLLAVDDRKPFLLLPRGISIAFPVRAEDKTPVQDLVIAGTDHFADNHNLMFPLCRLVGQALAIHAEYQTVPFDCVKQGPWLPIANDLNLLIRSALNIGDASNIRADDEGVLIPCGKVNGIEEGFGSSETWCGLRGGYDRRAEDETNACSNSIRPETDIVTHSTPPA